jgi:hypothetical protein
MGFAIIKKVRCLVSCTELYQVSVILANSRVPFTVLIKLKPQPRQRMIISTASSSVGRLPLTLTHLAPNVKWA